MSLRFLASAASSRL